MWTELREKLPTQRTMRGRLAVETALVALGVTLIGSGATWLATVLPAGDGEVSYQLDLLALFTAGVGTAAVALGHTAGRLVGNRRAVWLIPALALYSVDVVPDTALHASDDAAGAGAFDYGLIFDGLLIVVLLVGAIRPPARAGSGTAWCIAVSGLLLDPILGRANAAAFESTLPPAAQTAISLAVLIGWCTVSTAVVLVLQRQFGVS